MKDLTLTNVQLIDGTGAQPRHVAALAIQNGRVAGLYESTPKQVSETAQVIDLEGRTLLPGLINAHMHIMMDAGPDTFAYFHRHDLATVMLHAVKSGERIIRAGITTARDLGGFH